MKVNDQNVISKKIQSFNNFRYRNRKDERPWPSLDSRHGWRREEPLTQDLSWNRANVQVQLLQNQCIQLLALKIASSWIEFRQTDSVRWIGLAFFIYQFSKTRIPIRDEDTKSEVLHHLIVQSHKGGLWLFWFLHRLPEGQTRTPYL